jgi:3-oxoacyl-[acyl-carrier-protein] synthase II
MDLRRVVVTGLGGVTSLGLDFETTWTALLAGQNGIGPIESFDTKDFKTNFAGVVRGFVPEQHFEPIEAKKLDRFTQFALVGAATA